MKNIYLWLLISASSFVLIACDTEEKKLKYSAFLESIEVEAIPVILGTIPLKTVAPGSVVSDQKAQISSRLVGYIKNFDIKEGQNVKQGDLLFSIDSTDVRSGILHAESAYQQAKDALLDANLDYKRFKKLYEGESVSKQQFDKISLKFKLTKEQMIAAKTSLNQAKSQLKYANVTAPFDGVVVKKLASAGDLSAPGRPVLSLENKSSLSVKTQISHDLYAVIRVGDTATVILDGVDKPLMATIYATVSAADPKTRTHTIKLSLPKLSNVNSGAFARVVFTRGERQTMILPKSAILNRSGIEGVFVVENDLVYFNMVRLGEIIGDTIEIKSGVNLEDLVVVSNNESLLNGDKVVIADSSNKQ